MIKHEVPCRSNRLALAVIIILSLLPHDCHESE